MTPLGKVLGISLARPAPGSKRRLTLLPAINKPGSAAAYPLHEGTFRLSAVIELSAGYEIGNRGFFIVPSSDFLIQPTGVSFYFDVTIPHTFASGQTVGLETQYAHFGRLKLHCLPDGIVHDI